MTLNAIYAGGIALALAMAAPAAHAQVPAGYPADYAKVIDAAKKEGSVSIYAPIDAAVMGRFIKGFNELYPDIKVDYTDLNTNVIYNRFLSEVAGGAATADLLWSSALDLQGALAADGYAMPYESPELAELPEWVFWKEGVYGTTFEPFVFVYNKKLLREDQLPKGHADLKATFSAHPQAYNGKTLTQNPETSGLAFYGISSDARINPNFDEIPQALGQTKARLVTSVGEMMDLVSTGEVAFAYNVAASYANRSKSPDIGIIYPNDYIVVMSRLALLNNKAAHPNAGKLFLDFLLSEKGQQIAAEAGLYSLRSDIDSPLSAGALHKQYGDILKPPAIGPELTEYLNQTKRLQFFTNWKKNLAGG